MSAPSCRIELVAGQSGRGLRLDHFVRQHCPTLSRSRIQELIGEARVLVDGVPSKAARKLRGGEKVYVEAPERPPLFAEPEPIPLEILYEDRDVLVVNKPAGMSVHAGAGHTRGTLVNALLGRGQSLSRGAAVTDDLRPGIVHRLDKETSGVIAIAKNDFAHAKLADAFRSRAVQKTYIALAEGRFEKTTGKIDWPIGRDPVRRTRMKALAGPIAGRSHRLAGRARQALTEWHKLADLGPATLLEVQLRTGRTHQIRVHFSALKRPLVGDTLYGAAFHLHAGKTALPRLPRQFLHAAKLGFAHPRTGEWIETRAPLPADLREYLQHLARAEGRSLAAAEVYF